MAKNMARVRRQGLSKGGEFNEVAPETLVPGDVVRLSAADMIPGDLRLLVAKNLFINQSVLTGEAMPAEKFQTPYADAGGDSFDLPNMCFMGPSVISGHATGVIVRTGPRTFFGELPGPRGHAAPSQGIGMGACACRPVDGGPLERDESRAAFGLSLGTADPGTGRDCRNRCLHRARLKRWLGHPRTASSMDITFASRPMRRRRQRR